MNIKKLAKEKLKKFARANKKNMTFAEKVFLASFKNKYPNVNILPQYIIPRRNSGYIVDFYIPGSKLGIEIDGEYHNEPSQINYDIDRTTYIYMRGMKLERITNENVFNEERLFEFIKSLKIIKKKMKLSLEQREILQSKKERKTEKKKLKKKKEKPKGVNVVDMSKYMGAYSLRGRI